MQEEFFDSMSDEWMDGYTYGRSFEYDIINERTCEDELYCIEKYNGYWVMIDTKTAVEWGL
jgi:hypothetical protein